MLDRFVAPNGTPLLFLASCLCVFVSLWSPLYGLAVASHRVNVS